MPAIEVPPGAPTFRDEFVFLEEFANYAERFFEEYLHHSKGEWAGQLLELEDWQRDMVRTVFGWYKIADGTRRYRTLYGELPRKNGKSTIAAGFGLFLTVADGEPGAEVYSAAADKEQAMIVFEEARRMAQQSPEILAKCEVMTKAIVVPETTSVYRVISADAFTKHGFNAHGIIFDELHAQPNRDLYDVLTTSTGSRRSPLTVAITTAGYDKNSICWELHDYAIKVRDGIIDDPTFLAVIFAADPDDDWTSPETWKKANPNLGVSVSLDYLATACKRAQEVPGYENVFKRLHLNIWTEQETRWLAVATWDSNDLPRCSEAETRGRKCFVGLDLSTTTDITAAVWVFPREDGTFDIFPKFYVPLIGAAKRERKDRVPYPRWIKEGFITGTEGNVVDYEVIRQDILRGSKTTELREVAFDPWNATQLALQLAGDGIQTVQFRQGFATMTGPTKALEGLVLSNRLRHNCNPVLRWMISNVSVEQDPAGNIKPSKRKSTERIDGVVGLIMGIGRAILPSEDTRSVYQSRGVRNL